MFDTNDKQRINNFITKINEVELKDKNINFEYDLTDYDNKRLSAKHIEFIEQKAKVIKNKYLQDFNMKTFESTNEEISNTELNEEMLDQAKDNGVWINNADGSGIVFAIEFADGSLGLVENEQGELLQINFDDDSYKLPGTDVIINMGQQDEEEPI